MRFTLSIVHPLAVRPILLVTVAAGNLYREVSEDHDSVLRDALVRVGRERETPGLGGCGGRLQRTRLW
jgi:hypothetical protein